MYKSGDLGKWTKEGEIVCLGRKDFQVKIRGQRIELSEIENTIKEINGIDHAAVIDKQNNNGDKYLIGYYIINKEVDNKINNDDIRNYLKSKLPTYMIPNYFICLDELPLTMNGKLDRRALPEPNIDEIMEEKYVPPKSDMERSLCRIYSEVFNVEEDKIGRTSSFYELGGDSLNAIKIISKIKKEYKVKLNLKDILEKSIIEILAQFIENNLHSNSKDYQMDIIKNYNKKEFPIATILSGVAFNTSNIDFNLFKSFNNNMYHFYKLDKELNLNKLNNAINILVNRHEILKGYFIEKDEKNEKKIYCKIRDKVEVNIKMYTLENIEEFTKPFDITKDVLIRVGILNNSILMFNIEHKIADGYSFGILINDLYRIYNDESMEKLPIQYSDYAIYYNNKIISNDFDDQLKYYQSLFDCDFEVINLQKKEVANCTNKKEYKLISVNTDTKIYDIINKVSKENNLSKTAIFFTIYNLAISIQTNQKHIFSAIRNINRNHTNTEDLIGLFVKYMPILVNIENVNLIELIKNCMNTIVAVFGHDIPYSYVCDKLNLPQCNSWFKYDPYELYSSKEVENFVKEVDSEEILSLFNNNDNNIMNKMPSTESHTNLEFIVTEKRDYYEISFIYNSNMYEENTIHCILDHFLKIISDEKYFVEDVNMIKSSCFTKTPINKKRFTNILKYDSFRFELEDLSESFNTKNKNNSKYINNSTDNNNETNKCNVVNSNTDLNKSKKHKFKKLINYIKNSFHFSKKGNK